MKSESTLSFIWARETKAQRELFLTLEKLPMHYASFNYSELPDNAKESFRVFISILGV